MMKNFFPFSLVFILYHAVLISGLLYVVLSGKLSVTTDFMALLPTNGISEGVSRAEKNFVAKQNAEVTILIGHPDFAAAKSNAEKMYETLIADDIFTRLDLFNADIDPAAFSSFFSKYRYQLLPETVRNEISRDPLEFQQNSLAAIFSPMTFQPLENLESDPFFIDNTIFTDFIQKAGGMTPVMPKEGVLAVEHSGIWYVLLQGTLSEKALDISRTRGGIDTIYAVGDQLECETADLSISYSGFPFHSYESASNAQKEITVISTVSIALIIILFLVLLKNLYVVGLFLIGIFFSILSAFSAVIICFPDVHILTMIFGTSLIGTSIDYAVHYYLGYAKRNRNENGAAVARRLSKNLSVSLISTVLCYVMILFSPYDILRQVALFSVAGLISSFLTVMGFFPLISYPSMVSQTALAWKIPCAKNHKSLLLPLLGIAAALFVFAAGNLRIHNNILSLYQMSDRLLESEKTAGTVLGVMSSTYAIIEGENEFDAREKEYTFAQALQELRDCGSIENYLSVSSFVPAPSVQKANFAVSQKLLPLLDEQCRILGTDRNAAAASLLEEQAVIGFSDIPEQFSKLLGRLVPGESDGKYYLAVLIFAGSGSEQVRQAAAECEGVTYFQKSSDVSRQLDELTFIILKIFAAAFILIIILLLGVFKKRGIYFALAPVITILTVFAVVGMLNVSIDFFFSVGLLLVIGLGLDYMVFAGNSKKKPMLAITLSYITTALSFGSLMLSSFQPVHIFGVTVFIGTSAAFVTALCAGNSEAQ